jgi:hypothetical protein
MRLAKILMIGSLVSVTATSSPQQTPLKLNPQTRELGVGDVAAAERFREISKDEMKQGAMFQDALASLSKKGSSTHSNTP